MWRNLILVTVAATGLSVVAASNADARMGIGGHGRAGASVGMSAGRMATARTRTAFTARAQVRGPSFRPPGWSHGRKVGWHCSVGARGCRPPGLR